LRTARPTALDIELCEAVAAQFDALRNTTAQAVVLTGQGRMFSAGVDLIRLGEGGAPYVRRFLPALHRMFEAVFFHPKPVVAAINGHAIAGGCVLASCADRRIGAREAGRMGVTELLVGVPFPALAFEVMRFATPPAFFAETILSGATYPSEVALARRMIDEMVEPAELLDRAIAAAHTLAALSPEAFAQTKQQLRQPAADALERHGQRVDTVAMDIWTAPETLARVRDYVARTLKKA
jgi:enoyl-CoA hydratase